LGVVVPTLNHHTLDLWLLRKEVQKLGGFTAVTSQKKWGDVGRTLGYSAIPGVGTDLHQAYQKIIVPYEDFLVHVKNSPALTPGASMNGKTGVNMSAPESPTISRVTSIGSRGTPMTTIDLVLERQAKMGNGVAGDENRMARTRGDAEANGDARMTDVFKANSSEKPKSRMSTGLWFLLLSNLL
jgi:histone demethylase JARID1